MLEFISGPVISEKTMDQLMSILRPYNLWYLKGNLGSGKTHLIRQIGNRLNFLKEISSPTFSIINEYSPGTNEWKIEKIYHIDLYRLSDSSDLISTGVMEILLSNELSIIEWPEILEQNYNDLRHVEINIQYYDPESRIYKINIIQ